MKTVWILLWCVDSCLRGGVFVEGPQDWAHQTTVEGRPFCAQGGCNAPRTCDIARVDLLDKAKAKHRWATAHCAEEPTSGRFDYDADN